MFTEIAIANINDFSFCPASIYFNKMYEGTEDLLYKKSTQINGTYAHKYIDEGIAYNKNVISGIWVYSRKFNIVGKIDKYFIDNKELVECKNNITNIYDGYIFQIYAQYFCMTEMGYSVNALNLYCIKENKKYNIKLPFENLIMLEKFKNILHDMKNFSLNNFYPDSVEKCSNCIYSNICYWGI